jgi:hypothetical protein
VLTDTGHLSPPETPDQVAVDIPLRRELTLRVTIRTGPGVCMFLDAVSVPVRTPPRRLSLAALGSYCRSDGVSAWVAQGLLVDGSQYNRICPVPAFGLPLLA